MFFAGQADQGHCPAGGPHDASESGNYLMIFGEGAFNTQPQGGWRFCQKCQGLFFDGPPNPRGACPASGQHDPSASGHYLMVFGDGTEPNSQGSWRFCKKCQGMFFAGHADQGHCPAGGPHDASASGPYQISRDLPDVVTLNSGPITSGLSIGGFGTLVMSHTG